MILLLITDARHRFQRRAYRVVFGASFISYAKGKDSSVLIRAGFSPKK
jgi:hypothetical protein